MSTIPIPQRAVISVNNEAVISTHAGHARFMTYNVLAEQYAIGPRARFAFCPKDALAWPSRLRRIVNDVLRLAPDVVSMQEVEAGAFAGQLLPLLRLRGYEGAYVKNDGNEEPVGVAIFWRACRYVLADRKQWSVAELSKSTPAVYSRFRSEPVKAPPAVAPPAAPEGGASAPAPAPVEPPASVGVWPASQAKGHDSLWSWLVTMKHVGLCVALLPTGAATDDGATLPAAKRARVELVAGSGEGNTDITDSEWATIAATLPAPAPEGAAAAAIVGPDGSTASAPPVTPAAPAPAPAPKAPAAERVALGAVPAEGAFAAYSGTGQPLVVTNCHAFWDPKWPEAKAMQLALWVEATDHVRHAAAAATGRGDTAVVLCGDLNTVPSIAAPTDFDVLPGPPGSDAAWPLVPGVYHMLTHGHLPLEHAHHPFTRRSRTTGADGNKEMAMFTHRYDNPKKDDFGLPHKHNNKEQPHPESAKLTLPLKFVSAHAAVAGAEPAWTNHTGYFTGCLVYIFVATHTLTGGEGAGATWAPLDSAPVPVEALAEPQLEDVASIVTAAGGPATVPAQAAASDAPAAAETGTGGDKTATAPAPIPVSACPNVAVPSDHVPVVVSLAVKPE